MSKPPALRRIQADIRELAMDPSDQYTASPLEDDMFEWHFTIRGATDTDFDGGVYHGRILLPSDYPFKPPHIVFLTPSGRFETGVKVCLSFSAHHPELWQPAWGIRLILEALISFLPTPADGAIGALDWSSKERKKLAKQSVNYCCPSCGLVKDLIPEIGSIKTRTNKKSTSRFQAEIAKLKELQALNEAGNKKEAAKERSSDDENAVKTAAQTTIGTSTENDVLDGNSNSKNDDTDTTASAVASASSTASTSASVTPRGADAQELSVSKVATNSATEDKSQQNVRASRDMPSTETEVDRVETSGSASTTAVTQPISSLVGEQHAAESSLLNAPNPAKRKPDIGNKETDPILADPIIHAIFVCFVAIIVILYRKVQSLLAELQALEDDETQNST